MAYSSGEVRRRRNPKKPNPGRSYPSSPLSDAKPCRPENDHHYSDDNDNFRSSTGTSGTNCAPSEKEYDEYAWFVVFLMALSYFIVARGGHSSRGGVLSSFSKPYKVISSSVAIAKGNKENSEELLRSIFYADSSQQEESLMILTPNCRLEVILSSPPDINDNIYGEECKSNEGNNQKQNSIPFLSHLSSTTWVHDEELGRGYLLLADVGRSGRIWRWEVGGGPITIGRSLHMERSGCRSGMWVDSNKKGSNGTCPDNLFGDYFGTGKGKMSCFKSLTPTPSNQPLLGSASLAVELTRSAERSSVGNNIVVAEWGERRIVRVEGETGARTPLVTMVPYQSDDKTHGLQWRRVFRPNHLTYTPFGDLIFSDNLESEAIRQINNSTWNHLGVVYRRKEAVHVPPIPVDRSRDAHSWLSATNGQHEDGNIDILFETHGVIEGIALGVDFSTLFVLVATPANHSGGTKSVYKVQLSADEGDHNNGNGDKADNDDDGFTVFYETADSNCESPELYYLIGSKLAVDERGIIYLIACPTSVTLLDKEDGHVVGSLALDKLQKSGKYHSTTSSFTSIGFGEDGYLYITSPTELMRLKTRVGGMTLPTNLVVPPPLKTAKGDSSTPMADGKRDKS